MHKLKNKLMKKIISLFALSAIVATLIFSGCKKGENDPFLSLKSRTARLAHTWKLSSENFTITYTGSNYTSTTVYSYDGTSETQTTTNTYGSNSNTTTATKTYSEEVTFDKAGTYESTIVDDGDVETEKGNWMWTNKNKDQDIKNKEAIVMTSTSNSNLNYTNSGKTNDPVEILVFDKLSSTEIIISFDYIETDSDGHTYKESGTKTYTKK